MALHDTLGDRVFLPHLIGETRHRRTLLQQAKRHLHRLRGLRLQRCELLPCPFAAIGFKRREDLLKVITGEQPIDSVSMREYARVKWGSGEIVQHSLDGLGIGNDLRLCRLDALGGHVMCRKAKRVCLCAIQAMPGEGQILADAAGKA